MDMKRAYFLMHAAIILWGFTGILGKAIHLNEGLIVWYRLFISAAALLLYIKWKKINLALPATEMFKLTLVGIVVCLHWITFYGAIKVSNVSVTLACFSSITLFTALLEPFFNKSKHSRSEIFFGLGVIAGIYLIFAFQKLFAFGILLSLISALLGAIFTILNKKFVARHDPSAVTFYELASGFIFLSLLLPVYLQNTHQEFELPSSLDWIYLLLLGIVCTTLAFTISLEALKKINAFTMNLSVNLEPIYSIVLAILIFKENKELGTGFYAGTLFIISTVVLHSFFQFRKFRSK